MTEEGQEKVRSVYYAELAELELRGSVTGLFWGGGQNQGTLEELDYPRYPTWPWAPLLKVRTPGVNWPQTPRRGSGAMILFTA